MTSETKGKAAHVPGTTKLPNGGYAGVINLNGKRVWTCPHIHPNRDADTHLNTAAFGCAERTLHYALGNPKREHPLVWAPNLPPWAARDNQRLNALEDQSWALAAIAKATLSPSEAGK